MNTKYYLVRAEAVDERFKELSKESKRSLRMDAELVTLIQIQSCVQIELADNWVYGQEEATPEVAEQKEVA